MHDEGTSPCQFSPILFTLVFASFRRAPHRWLLTFSILTSHRADNDIMPPSPLKHPQKVSGSIALVSAAVVSRSLARVEVCLYLRDQFPLCLLSASFAPGLKAISLFARVEQSLGKYAACRPITVSACRIRRSDFFAARSQLGPLCNCDDLTDAASRRSRPPVVYNNL